MQGQSPCGVGSACIVADGVTTIAGFGTIFGAGDPFAQKAPPLTGGTARHAAARPEAIPMSGKEAFGTVGFPSITALIGLLVQTLPRCGTERA